MPVLVVDDEEDIREDLADLLRDEGYEVFTAANGAEALAQLRSGRIPCLILLDLMMPVMDGYEFRAQQANDPALAAVPVLVVSGAGSVREKAHKLNVAGFLEKPFRLKALLEAVQQFCP